MVRLRTTSCSSVRGAYRWRVLECRVLGPVGVLVDGVPVEVGGALPRRLVLADGMAVSDDRLALAMWDDQPPAKAAYGASPR